MKKNLKLIIFILLISTFIVPKVFATPVNFFIKNYDTEKTSFGKTNYNALYKMDNLALGDTTLTISFTHENEIEDSNCNTDYCLIIKQYDKTGTKINELYIQNIENTISARVIDNELYMVNTYYKDINYHYSGGNEMYIEKYNNKLEKISSLQITESEYSSGDNSLINYMMLAAHMPGQVSNSIDGLWNTFLIGSSYYDMSSNCIYSYKHHYYDYYDFYQINEEDDNIIVYSLRNDYVFDKDLTTMTTRNNTWTEKYGNGDDYSYNFIDSNTYLESGSVEVAEDDYSGFIKLYENDKVTFEYENNDYYAFYFPIKVNNNYLVLALNDNDTTDILVIDENKNILQTFTGNYWNLRALDDGFVVTNIGTSIYNYTMNASKNQEIYSEVYSIYNIETKADNGNITYTNNGNLVTFIVTPNDGYVLGEVKVTDSNGNTIIFTNNTFTMPNADVTIEATFKKETILTKIDNPNTSTREDILLVVIIALISALTSIILVIKKKKVISYI